MLVASQVALSLMLLTIAGFTVQLARREIAAGRIPDTHVAKITMDPGQARYAGRRDSVLSSCSSRRGGPGCGGLFDGVDAAHWHRSFLVLPEGSRLTRNPPAPCGRTASRIGFTRWESHCWQAEISGTTTGSKA